MKVSRKLNIRKLIKIIMLLYGDELNRSDKDQDCYRTSKTKSNTKTCNAIPRLNCKTAQSCF